MVNVHTCVQGEVSLRNQNWIKSEFWVDLPSMVTVTPRVLNKIRKKELSE